MAKMSEKELLDRKPWYNPGKWFVTPVTWLPEVRATMPNLPKRVYIQDTTLREGEENISVGFTMDQKVEIARRLSEMGVAIVDVGYAGHPYQEESLKTIMDAGVIKPPTKVQIFTRSEDPEEVRKQIDRIVDKGATATGIVAWTIQRTPEGQQMWVDAVKYAKKNYPDLFVTLSYVTTTGTITRPKEWKTLKSSFDWQVELAKKAVEAGADRIQMSDSFGCGSPAAIKYIASQFREAIGPDKGLLSHNHNDYGQAVACAMAAVEGGANYLDTAVNGLGDRAGNTAAEEIIMAIQCLYGIDTGINLDRIYGMSRYVQEAAGVKVQPWKAVVGNLVWAEDSHSAGLVRLKWEGVNWFEGGMETYNPQVVGQTHQMFFGKTVLNVGTVKSFLDHLNLSYDDETINTIIWAGMKEIDDRAARGENRWLTEEEVNELCRKYAKKPK